MKILASAEKPSSKGDEKSRSQWKDGDEDTEAGRQARVQVGSMGNVR